MCALNRTHETDTKDNSSHRLSTKADKMAKWLSLEPSLPPEEEKLNETVPTERGVHRR